MKNSLLKRSEYYQKTYGVVPTFKAGIHCGRVTTGEIGVVKKEIVFSGDVLNAAARIQGLCNQYQTDLLFSEDFSEKIKSHQGIKSLDETELRGRNEKIKIYSISE